MCECNYSQDLFLSDLFPLYLRAFVSSPSNLTKYYKVDICTITGREDRTDAQQRIDYLLGQYKPMQPAELEPTSIPSVTEAAAAATAKGGGGGVLARWRRARRRRSAPIGCISSLLTQRSSQPHVHRLQRSFAAFRLFYGGSGWVNISAARLCTDKCAGSYWCAVFHCYLLA